MYNSILSSRKAPVDTLKNLIENLFLGVTIGINLNVYK